MQESPLLELVPPDLLLRRPPLSDDRNALFPWREAAASLVHEEEADHLAWRGEEECDCQSPGCLTCYPISDREFYDRLARLLDDNAAALRLFREGLARGQFQIPLRRPMFDDDQFSIVQMRALARLTRLKAVLARHERDWDAAVSAIEELMVFGRLCATGGLSIQFIIGNMIQRSGLTQMIEFSKASPDRRAMEKLLATLNLVIGADELADTLRGELCLWAIPLLEQMPREGITTQVDLMIKETYANRPIMHDLPDSWADDGRLDKRRRQILYLLEDHPSPWDAPDTVRLLSENYGAWIAYLDSLATEGSTLDAAPSPSGKIRQICSALTQGVGNLWAPKPSALWPEALSPSVIYEMVGSSAAAQAERDEMAKMMGKSPKDFQPLSQADLSRWRKKVRATHNPIGQLLAEQLMPSINETLLQQLHGEAATARQALELAMSA